MEKYIRYRGKGEHSISELEKIIEQREEELHNLKVIKPKKLKWGIGEKVKITRRIYGHDFGIGDIVEIFEYNPTQTSSWKCFDSSGMVWWLSEDEGEIVQGYILEAISYNG